MGAINTWVGTIVIFDGNRRLSRKRCEIGRWFLCNVNNNKQSWVPDWMVSFSMTLSDPNPCFKIQWPWLSYKSNISKMVRFRDKITKEHYKETIYNLSNGTTFNDFEWSLTPISRSRHLSTLNISEKTPDKAIVTIETQYEVVCALSNGDISNDLDGP